MSNDRIDALERHALVMTEALRRLIDCTSALAAVNGATMALLDPADRAAIHTAALAGLGDSPATERARGIVVELTHDPTAAQARLQAAVTSAQAARPARLQ
jgi:hypothetical protein